MFLSWFAPGRRRVDSCSGRERKSDRGLRMAWARRSLVQFRRTSGPRSPKQAFYFVNFEFSFWVVRYVESRFKNWLQTPFLFESKDRTPESGQIFKSIKLPLNWNWDRTRFRWSGSTASGKQHKCLLRRQSKSDVLETKTPKSYLH
jgi:hypothetical protein